MAMTEPATAIYDQLFTQFEADLRARTAAWIISRLQRRPLRLRAEAVGDTCVDRQKVNGREHRSDVSRLAQASSMIDSRALRKASFSSRVPMHVLRPFASPG